MMAQALDGGRGLHRGCLPAALRHLLRRLSSQRRQPVGSDRPLRSLLRCNLASAPRCGTPHGGTPAARWCLLGANRGEAHRLAAGQRCIELISLSLSLSLSPPLSLSLLLSCSLSLFLSLFLSLSLSLSLSFFLSLFRSLSLSLSFSLSLSLSPPLSLCLEIYIQ